MGGLFVLALIIGCAALTIWLLIKVQPLWGKAAVLVTVILIPSADAVMGRIYLQQLCAKEGGLKVYRVVEGVKGFMDYGGVDAYWVKEHGYQFIESSPLGGGVIRFSRQDGQIVTEENTLPKSLYRVRLAFDGKKDIYEKSHYIVEIIPTSEVLATYTQIIFKGGWVERFLAEFSDAGVGSVARCDSVPWQPEIRHEQVIISSLKH